MYGCSLMSHGSVPAIHVPEDSSEFESVLPGDLCSDSGKLVVRGGMARKENWFRDYTACTEDHQPGTYERSKTES